MIVPPNADVHAEALARLDGLAKPLGALGRLEELGAFISACQGECPPRPLDNVRAVLLAGDHGAVANGVASYPKEVTVAMVHALVNGVAGMSVLAAQHGVGMRVLDIAVDADLDVPAEVTEHKLRKSCGSIDREDALSVAECEQALATGATIAEQEARAGAQLLIVGDLGIGNTTPAAALIASQLGLPAGQVTGRGAGLSDEGLAAKTGFVQRSLERTAALTDPVHRLAALGSADLAVAVGIYIEAARRGVPVLLDGVISVAEALLAEAIAPGAKAWMIAGHRSVEPAQGFALEALGLEPLLDLRMRLGEGSGAMTALPLVRSGVAIIRDMALLADLVG